MLKVIAEYEISTGQANSHLNELLKNSLTLQESKISVGLEKKNLIDYVPLNFSRPDFLDLMDEHWFQKTAIVCVFLVLHFFFKS